MANEGISRIGNAFKKRLKLASKGGKFQQNPDDKAAGMLINVESKGSNPPRHMDVIHHKG